ncbi:MAG: patatin-like phospholipase family protein [Pseudomonadota bacterium]
MTGAPKFQPKWVGVFALIAATTACSAPPRDPATVLAIQTQADRYEAEREAESEATRQRLIDRGDAIASGRTRDSTFDILLLSGGADWGAFGAGFLAAWNELGDAAAYPMPEFDVISGISTGALIGSYIVDQQPASYSGIEAFYRDTSSDWVTFNGLPGLLPGSLAVLDNTGVREQVAANVDAALIEALREARDDDRMLMIGATDLDFGQLRYFEMGDVATVHADPKERLVSILMAATAIPGLFPPEKIDGYLYGDGGAVQGAPGIQPRNMPLFRQAWADRFGDRPFPPVRLWWIFNNQLELEPEAVELSWFSVLFRSYQTISQTSFKAPLQANLLMAESTKRTGQGDIEVRWVAIPSDFVPPEDARPFDPAVTNRLADIGREVAAQPGGGWRTDLPD